MIGAELWTLLIGAAGVLVTLAGIIWKSRQAGRDSVLAEQSRKADERRSQFNRIDRNAPDLDASLDRLHKRSKRRDTNAS